jgi:hypothetical protein
MLDQLSSFIVREFGISVCNVIVTILVVMLVIAMTVMCIQLVVTVVVSYSRFSVSYASVY